MRVVLVALLLSLATGSSAQTLVEHYTAAMRARADGDLATYHDQMEAALAIEPGHAVLQFHLGRGCAGLERSTEAFDWLRRAYHQGAWMDPRTDPFLEPLHDREGWNALVALADSVGVHHGPGLVGLELSEFDLMPEGIDYDPPTDRFVLGSAHKRKILLVDRDGTTEEFVQPGQDGVLGVLGVRVDSARRRLWAVSVGDATLIGEAPDAEGLSRVHCWSLEDGRLLGSWSSPADSMVHAFNDLALREDGRAVITASGSGALFEAALGEDELRELLAPGTLRGPNGIAIRADTAWVSEYVYGVARLDLQTLAITRLSVPDDIALIGVDGLYLHGSELVAVQNYAGLDRVAAFVLDRSGNAITSARVLESRHPRAHDPTTAVIVDGEAWYIANSHIAGFDARTDAPDAGTWGTVLVLRAPL